MGKLFQSAGFAALSQSILLGLEPETAHRATISALKLGVFPRARYNDPIELATEICGLKLSNPIGMAAGFDKNGEVAAALGQVGFGFAEAGTVTPRPQHGNDRPRLFRLPACHGIINRMGFNNDGHDQVFQNLNRQRLTAPLGVNIGANKDSPDFVTDYVAGVKRFARLADYLTVNISSPNTPGLRDLQAGEALGRLLDKVLEERERAGAGTPVFLKLAPDLDETEMDEISKVILSCPLDGLIISNTTIDKSSVAGLPYADESGGLSGRPLFELSTQRLAQMRLRMGPDLAIIGVGGIHSAASAIAKLEAGANALQLYSALVFGGMSLLEEIKAGIAAAVRNAGDRTLAQLTGRAAADWASGKASL